MKFDIYNIMYRLVTIISIIGCFVPFAILILKKLWKENLYILICGYWLLNGLININSLFNFSVNGKLEDYITLTANSLDIPIVLGIFYLASSGTRRVALKKTLLLFIAFEVIITFIKGFNYTSSTIIVGAGLVIVLVYGVLGIMTYLSKVEHTPAENVMVFVYSSFLFFYGTFTIIYIFSYLTDIGNDNDNFFLYYVELFVAAIPATYGLLRYGNIQRAKYRFPVLR